VAKNLAGLGVLYNANSTLNQQSFQLLAVPGGLTLVMINGVLQKSSTYSIPPNSSVLTLNDALPAGAWVFVLSGQGGTFIPQSYVDTQLAQKANTTTVNTALGTKMD